MSKDLYWPGEKKVDWEKAKEPYTHVSPFANFGLFTLCIFWAAMFCEGIVFVLAI